LRSKIDPERDMKSDEKEDFIRSEGPESTRSKIDPERDMKSDEKEVRYELRKLRMWRAEEAESGKICLHKVRQSRDKRSERRRNRKELLRADNGKKIV